MPEQHEQKKYCLLCVAACAALALLLLIGAYELFFTSGGSSFSVEENRLLAQRPAFSWTTFRNKSFADDLEKYLADRFPARNRIIDFDRDLRQAGSLASWEDYARAAESDVAVMEFDAEADTQIAVLVTPRPTRTPTPVSSHTPIAAALPTGSSRPDGEQTPSPSPIPTDTPRPTKVPVDAGSFPSVLRLYLLDGTKETAPLSMARTDVMAWAGLLDAYASLLPPDGLLLVTVPPNSVRASRLLAAEDPQGMVSEFEPFLYAATAQNVLTVTAADLLSRHMLAGEYVYFRSDRHWTPYGAYLVTSRLMELTGRTLPAYDAFSKKQEYPFLGNIYRDSRNRQLENDPDTLDILTPSYPVRVTRYADKTIAREVPYIDWNANALDRYTVYLGGPSGRLNVIERLDAPEDRTNTTCLLITDSFGLCSVPYLLEGYDRIVLYDARYYEPFAMGAISEHVEAYGVQDIYVILDEGSFAGGTYISLCNRQF